MALGVYLRKFMLEYLERSDVTLDTQSFGKFSLVADPEADAESLYPKKIVYEPNVGLVKQVAKSAMNVLDSAAS